MLFSGVRSRVGSELFATYGLRGDQCRIFIANQSLRCDEGHFLLATHGLRGGVGNILLATHGLRGGVGNILLATHGLCGEEGNISLVILGLHGQVLGGLLGHGRAEKSPRVRQLNGCGNASLALLILDGFFPRVVDPDRVD